MTKHMSKRQAGVTLVELLLYIAILAGVLVVATNGIVQMGKVYAIARNERRVAGVAQAALERIIKEIRLACDVAVIAGSPQSLQLTTYQAFSPGMLTPDCSTNFAQKVEKNVTLSSGRIMLDSQYLSPAASVVTINSLQFQDVSDIDSFSKAVRIFLQVTAGSGQQQVSHAYYATAILRNSY